MIQNEVIGQRYLIVRQLREEPWGEVWLAQDNLLRTEVGLKLFPRDSLDWAAARDMFELAAVLGLKLRHPQILGVFHVDKAEKYLYLVEEPFDGESLLTQLARPQRFSTSQALQLLELLGQVLAFAHQQGVAHRGLSPLNILMQGEDLRVANFAFVPAYGDLPLHLELKAYTSPEVVHGDQPTPASDVFSLGVLGFRLVAGSLPYPLTFDEPFPYRLEYPPVDLEEIPIPLQNLLLQCLVEDPEERLPHAGAFVGQLQQAREQLDVVDKRAPAAWGAEKPRLRWQPLAQAGPLLKKVWEDSLPHAQKAKETALTHWQTLKQMPRRLWWGVGLAAVIIALIIAGVKMGHRPASLPPPTTVAAPVNLPPVGGGPPLVASAEPKTPGGPVPATGPATAQTRATTLATRRGPGREAKGDRYLLIAATYVNLKPAQALQKRLRAEKLHAVIVTRKSGKKTLYQVRVGPLTGAKAAADAASRIKNQEKITPKVVKLKPKATNKHSRRPTR
jgi:cell division septation protein DedD